MFIRREAEGCPLLPASLLRFAAPKLSYTPAHGSVRSLILLKATGAKGGLDPLPPANQPPGPLQNRQKPHFGLHFLVHLIKIQAFKTAIIQADTQGKLSPPARTFQTAW